VSLNRAVALPINQIAATSELDSFHLLHAGRADLPRQLGDDLAAAISYRRAVLLATNGRERRYLERRLSQVGVS
jgi:RNA polymerase sigma-70 factor (ECF subfamily)